MWLPNFKKGMVPQLIAAKQANVPFILVHLDEFQKYGSLPAKPDIRTASHLFSKLQTWFGSGDHSWVTTQSAGLGGYRPRVVFLFSGNVFPRSTVQTKDSCQQVGDQIQAIMGNGTYGPDGARRPTSRNIVITYLPAIKDVERLMESEFNRDLLPQFMNGVNGSFLAGMAFSVSSDFFELLAKYGRMAEVSQDSGARGVLDNMTHMRQEIVRCLQPLPLCPGARSTHSHTHTHTHTAYLTIYSRGRGEITRNYLLV